MHDSRGRSHSIGKGFVVECGLEMYLHWCRMWIKCIPDELLKWFGQSKLDLF